MRAWRAGPPSPVQPARPLSATMTMIPVSASTLRIRWAPASAIQTSPRAPCSTAEGEIRQALIDRGAAVSPVGTRPLAGDRDYALDQLTRRALP